MLLECWSVVSNDSKTMGGSVPSQPDRALLPGRVGGELGEAVHVELRVEHDIALQSDGPDVVRARGCQVARLGAPGRRERGL
jgi:hypothetical protein